MSEQTSVNGLIASSDAARWRALLPASRSVFGSVEYARIVERQRGYEARLFTLDTPGYRVSYPVFLRAIPAQFNVLGASWDTLTPEYTGPLLVEGSDVNGLEFARAWSDACRAAGIVAEFAHLHPWDARLDCLDQLGISEDRDIIYVDLDLPVDVLREDSFNYACRKNLRRAQSEGIEVRPAQDRRDIIEFHRIYSSTMDRNNALNSYYFSLEYFMSFYEEMPDNACFMLAWRKGEAIAGTLYLHDAVDVYSYLGGADYEHQQMRPSNAVVYETIKWAQSLGKKRLILGGGYRPDDGIFRFKASFSPLRACFKVYRKIHLREEYESLIAAWTSGMGGHPATTTYFPAYRAPAVARPVEEPVELRSHD